MITAGSQRGLDFLGKPFLGAGDTALVTAPTYLGAPQAFNPYEPRYATLVPDGNEPTAEAARTAANEAEAAGSQMRLAYVVPDFANPTGKTLSRASREQLLKVADALDIPLIEDAAYQALRFEGEAVPSLLALDGARAGGIEGARTIHCDTFSKTLAPALRLGWIAAAAEVVRKLVLVKQAADLHCATVNQVVMHQVAGTRTGGRTTCCAAPGATASACRTRSPTSPTPCAGCCTTRTSRWPPSPCPPPASPRATWPSGARAMCNPSRPAASGASPCGSATSIRRRPRQPRRGSRPAPASRAYDWAEARRFGRRCVATVTREDRMKLQGRIAIITGADSGIGQATAALDEHAHRDGLDGQHGRRPQTAIGLAGA